MSNWNGEGQKSKWCYRANEWCTPEILKRCAHTANITRNMGGMQQSTIVCIEQAYLIMLSEINAKTAGKEQKQKIILP